MRRRSQGVDIVIGLVWVVVLPIALFLFLVLGPFVLAYMWP